MDIGVDVVDLRVDDIAVLVSEALFCFFDEFVIVALDENLDCFGAGVAFAEMFECAHIGMVVRAI